MNLKLVVANGKSAGRSIPISGAKFFIGRAEDCHLRPHSDLVSRHHCVILVEDGYVAVRDFASKNGTFVNDERVDTERELKNGDRLSVGQLQFEVQWTVEVSGKKKPAVHSVQEVAARTVETAVAKATSADHDEMDLDDLLRDPEPTAASVSEMETRPLEMAPAEPSAESITQAVEPLPPAPPQQQPSAPAHSADPTATKTPTAETEAKTKPIEKKAPLRPKPQAPPASGNSQNAAADVLKNFFKGRR